MAKLFLVVCSLFSFHVDHVIRRWWLWGERDAKRRWVREHCGAVRKACHRQIIRREAHRCPVPTVSILRSLPTLRTIWFIHRCWLQLILVRAQVNPALHRRTDVTSLSRTFVVSLFPLLFVPGLQVNPLQTGRAGDFWSVHDIGVREVHKSLLEYWNVNALNFPVVVVYVLSRKITGSLYAIAGYDNLDSLFYYQVFTLKPFITTQAFFALMYIFTRPIFIST